MQQIVGVFTSLISILLNLLQLLIMARAVISWFPVEDDHPIVNFLYLCTEPLIAPIRAILERFPALRELPIDLSSFVALLLLILLSSLLPEVHF